MRISGFTMVRNASKFYFPIKESILSVLPLVDEFIVALGQGDDDDQTLELIESIASPKIKIFHRIWSEEDFKESKIFAMETNFALQQCTGDWCFYIQADEAIHEQDYETIKQACTKELNNINVDGLLFKYYHFFGDYNHYLPFHGWYRHEIRIIRNHAHIYSFRDAQSFRKNNDDKLNVKKIDAHIYHYGWVRPPHLMQSKKKEHDSIHHGIEKIEEEYKLKPNEFDYGALGKIPIFKGSQPKVMHGFIQNLNWQKKLNFTKKAKLNRPKMKHEKTKNKWLSFVENNILNGNELFGFKNWKIVK